MPPLTTAAPARPRAQRGERVPVDIERPRRVAVGDYLLDGALDFAVDRRPGGQQPFPVSGQGDRR